MGSRRDFFFKTLSGSLLFGGGGLLGFWGRGQVKESFFSDDQIESLVENSSYSRNQLHSEILKHRQNRLQNPLGAAPKSKKLFQQMEQYWSDYALQWQIRNNLRLDLSRLHGIPFKNLILRPGSTIILYDLVRGLGKKSGPVVLTNPDYYLVEKFLTWEGLPHQSVSPGPDLYVNLKKLQSMASGASLIYLSNPHLPYGQFHQKDKMEKFISSCSPTPVVVDEAYIHYVGKNYEDQSCIDLTKKYPNLIVTRTFSKAYGLAGLRLGYFVASEEMLKRAGWFDREVSPHSCLAGIGALQDSHFIKKSRKQTHESQQFISKFLRNKNIDHIVGYGNFVACRQKEITQSKIQELKEENIHFQPTKDGHYYHLVPTLFPKDVNEHLNRLTRIIKRE